VILAPTVAGPATELLTSSDDSATEVRRKPYLRGTGTLPRHLSFPGTQFLRLHFGDSPSQMLPSLQPAAPPSQSPESHERRSLSRAGEDVRIVLPKVQLAPSQ